MNVEEMPLHGVRVLEAGVLLAGPYCGQLLGDFGAEVIKVETPGVGDPMRQWGQAQAGGHAVWWPIVARNKKSIELDLRAAAGQEAFRKLAQESDVVLENFRPGTFERWGLGYEQLSAANPGLVMTRVSGFGQTGPYANRPGYASVGEAMAGLRHVVGYADRPPARVGISLGDSLAGTFAALGTMMALWHRQRSRRGQVVDAAIYESVFALMEALLPEYSLGGHVRSRTGPILPNVAPSNAYPTIDEGRDLVIAANQDSVFRRLCVAMGKPDLVNDVRFATHNARGSAQVELDELISSWTRTRTTTELVRILEEHAVPMGPIYRASEILTDEHYAAREAVVHMDDPQFGAFPMQGVFPKLTASPGGVRWTGPALGQHNEEILGGILEMSADDIRAAQYPATDGC